MIEPAAYLAYVLACVAVIAVPGPSVTIIVANSMRSGIAGGLWTVAGTQLGVAAMLAVLAAGLTTIVATMGAMFDVIRLLGAAYLIWLGIRLFCANGSFGMPEDQGAAPPARAMFWQGLVIIWSNPKALLFFGAFLPQFIDPAAGPTGQILLLGMTFMILATILDSGYALAAARTGALLSKRRMRIAQRISGSCLIGGGLWLVLARR